MNAEKYTARSGKIQYRPVLEMDETPEGGFCLACGMDTAYAEPDARKYTCEACGEPKVYGVEELCLMGLVKIAVD